MKNCVVRVFGPAVAKETMPRVLLWTPALSSSMRALRHTLLTFGSPWMPTCAMNPPMTRKKATSL